jgi:hypothetical protein
MHRVNGVFMEVRIFNCCKYRQINHFYEHILVFMFLVHFLVVNAWREWVERAAVVVHGKVVYLSIVSKALFSRDHFSKERIFQGPEKTIAFRSFRRLTLAFFAGSVD